MSAFINTFTAPNNRAKLSRATTSRPSRLHVPHPIHRRVRMCASTKTTLETFLRAAGGLGTLRFIAISDGAVLETIGRLDYDMKNFTIPNKGEYLSISNVDTTFECHINLSKIKNVTIGSEKAKMGDYQLHVIRLLGEDDKIVLSVLLQWDPSQGRGYYLHGAEDTFKQLLQRFGLQMSRPASITLEDCQSLFYLPVAQAAAVLGVSRPTISKVLRAHGIKRWPYRKLRAEGKIEMLRQRRENAHTSIHFAAPAPPSPPPLPPFLINKSQPKTQPTNVASNTNNDHEISAQSEPLFPEAQQVPPDDETYILHILDQPLSPPRQMEDHTHPFLTLEPQPLWTCDERLEQEHEQPLYENPVESPPSLPFEPQEIQEFSLDTNSHTISTVRPAARAVMGSGSWSHGVFQQDGDRTTFAFLPAMPFGSSLSDEDPLNANFENGV